ncbi:uncharacterized protein DFL_005110 [Arthrobotrys flagrans]|uniref:F-box domain-containing protein n=1 Tax=Arthrobotrys flagrans TaxID=97331 RepID=A0A437A6X4_ARTFL|nr:hypothetical protein DFL_005110 [Arthrobotrys flagrans]
MNGEEVPQRFPGMENTPSELHVQILQYLSSADVLGVIQALPPIQANILNWNLGYLDAVQLVSLQAKLLEIDTIPAPVADELRKKIIYFLPGAFGKFTESVSRRLSKGNENVRTDEKKDHLERHFFNCYFDDIKAVVSDLRKCKTQDLKNQTVIQFLAKFNHRNEVVRDFCDAVATADPSGRICRYDKIKPNQNTRFIHLLFWLATDYIRKHRRSTELPDQRTIAIHWSEFLHRVGTLFGPETQVSLRDCVLAKSVILLKYRDYVGGSHLTKIYNRLYQRAPGNLYTEPEDYSTFMLLQGLDLAYDLFREDDQAIEFIASREVREIRVCRNLWSHFEEPETAAGA